LYRAAASRRAGLPTAVDTTGGRVAAGAWRNRLAVSRLGRRVDACTAVVAPALRGACAARLRVRSDVTVTTVRVAVARGAGATVDDVDEGHDGVPGWGGRG